MVKTNKRTRMTEYKKVQEEIKLMGGQPGGWTNIDKKLKGLKQDKLTANDIQSLKDWIVKEKDTRKTALKTELEMLNDFFKMYVEEPKSLRQMGLYTKGLSKSSPMYDSLLESNKLEIEELEIMLRLGFKPLTSQFAWQNDERWQEIRKIMYEKKLNALKNQVKDIEEKLVLVEDEILKEKEEKDKRVSQIKEELKELGESFPKDELSYIG